MVRRVRLVPPVVYTSLIVALFCVVAGIVEGSALLIGSGSLILILGIASILMYRRWGD
jgi:hypothetical protein